jgi:hypothetical protein
MPDDLAAAREALIRETWARWNAGERDPSAIGAGLAEGFVLESALTGRVFHGRQGLIDWMAEIDDNFGAWRIRIEEIRAAGPDRFLILGSVHMRGRGSGVELDQPIGWVIEFEGELTRRLRNFASHEAAIEAAAGD